MSFKSFCQMLCRCNGIHTYTFHSCCPSASSPWIPFLWVSISTGWSQPCVPRLAVTRKLKVSGALGSAKTILPAPVKHPLRALSLAQDSSAFPPLAYHNALSALSSTISVSLASTPPPHHLLLGSLRCVTLHIRGASWHLSVGNELCRFSGNVIPPSHANAGSKGTRSFLLSPSLVLIHLNSVHNLQSCVVNI